MCDGTSTTSINHIVWVCVYKLDGMAGHATELVHLFLSRALRLGVTPRMSRAEPGRKYSYNDLAGRSDWLLVWPENPGEGTFRGRTISASRRVGYSSAGSSGFFSSVEGWGKGGDGVFELLLLFSAVVPVGDSGSRTGVIGGEGRAEVGVEKTSSLSELDDGCWAMGEGGWVSLTKQPWVRQVVTL